MLIMKKLPPTLEGQLLQIVKQGFLSALPRSKTRGKRNGNDMPLTAWMRGAFDSHQSKILAVDAGQMKYPYHNIGGGARHLATRIANRYQVTWIQHYHIEEHVLRFYRGHESDFTYKQSFYSADLQPKSTSEKTRYALFRVCDKLKKTTRELPLRVLIDPRVTNLLLLIELNERAKPKRNTIWTEIN